MATTRWMRRVTESLALDFLCGEKNIYNTNYVATYIGATPVSDIPRKSLQRADSPSEMQWKNKTPETFDGPSNAVQN